MDDIVVNFPLDNQSYIFRFSSFFLLQTSLIKTNACQFIFSELRNAVTYKERIIFSSLFVSLSLFF